MLEDFQQHGYFRARGGAVESRAGGVIRTNCIDCLDRTNVVQGLLARKVKIKGMHAYVCVCLLACTAVVLCGYGAYARCLYLPICVWDN